MPVATWRLFWIFSETVEASDVDGMLITLLGAYLAMVNRTQGDCRPRNSK
jgi:hypothetical protein